MEVNYSFFTNRRVACDMDDNRKQIIVKEILYWKDSKMLPEQYCNYLLALYTEGNQPQDTKEKPKTKIPLHNYFLLLLIPVFVFLLYFTELSFDLQMTLLFISLVAILFLTFYFFKKGFQFQIPLVILALLFLLLTVEIIVHFFPGDNVVLFSTLIINCLLWLITGKVLKILYFLLAGGLGIILLIIFMFI
jgi:hypothetical protein